MALEAPFAAQQGNAGVPQNSRETLINMFAEAGEGKSKLTRRQRPGVRLVDAVTGKKRGIAKFVHGHYLVSKRTLWRYAGGAATALGTLDTGVGRVTIVSDDNGNVAVSDGATLYHWDGAAFTKPATPTSVGTLSFIGGYGVYADPGTGQFYVSALNDLTSWDALDFATAENNADAIVRTFVDHNELFLFGTASVEVWRLSGAADFPLQPNAQMTRGCKAAFSVAADDNTVFWLGDDGIVYRMDGYRPQRISTHAVEEQIGAITGADAAEAFIYTFRGHKFFTLRFPDQLTLQFNIATGLWNRAKSYGHEDWQVVGNGEATDIYLTDEGIAALDGALNTDNGQIMERGGTSAPVTNNGDWLSVNALILEAEMGRVAAGRAEPQVVLEVSRDGETFGNARMRGLGETGDFRRRAVWRNLGQARQMMARFTFTDDAPFAVMAIRGEVEA